MFRFCCFVCRVLFSAYFQFEHFNVCGHKNLFIGCKTETEEMLPLRGGIWSGGWCLKKISSLFFALAMAT